MVSNKPCHSYLCIVQSVNGLVYNVHEPAAERISGGGGAGPQVMSKRVARGGSTSVTVTALWAVGTWMGIRNLVSSGAQERT